MARLAAFPHRAVILAALSFAPIASAAQELPAGIGTIAVADPTQPSDGTVHPAALAAQLHGPLPVSAAETVYKAALDRARAEELRRTAPPLARAPQSARRSPVVIKTNPGLNNFHGPPFTPSGTSGALGPTRAIQTVNRIAGLFDRVEGGLLATDRAPLYKLAGLHPSAVTQNPQILWDARSNRFYYAMSASEGASENRVAFGFSRTASPNNLSSAWCHYTYNYASRFLDHLRLGDNRDFIIFTGNGFSSGNFVGTDINAVSKPPGGPITTCPNSVTFKAGAAFSIRDSEGVLLASAVAANQIDDLDIGYVAARPGNILGGSNRFWFFNVGRNPATGNPFFSSARQLILPNYNTPPPAEQPDTRRLHPLDARLTNAVQARNPLRLAESWWTQHTVKHPTANLPMIRWYEIDPVPSTPVVLSTGTIGTQPQFAGMSIYNAAISPDRAVDGATRRFGNNFVITYNFSSPTINPGIAMASGVNGGPLTFRTVQNGVAPYRDLSCPDAFDLCNWLGASAAPDPRPDPDRPRTTRGVVFSTIQYSGRAVPRPDMTDWFTRIILAQP